MPLYRASEDGWLASDFHQKCDKKGATITLIQFKIGDCIGGFTKAEWTSGSGEYKKDESTILFNLDQNKSFPCLYP